MKNVKTYRNKNIFVLGAGMSGIHSAYLLNKLGAKRITINDKKPSYKCPGVNRLVDTFPAINAVMDVTEPKLLDEYHYDLLVKSPGIPYDNPVVKYAQKKGIPITVEVELASEINPGELDCVTGSDGKTTTTMLITRMLNNFYHDLSHTNFVPEILQNKHAYDAGNIGIDSSLTAEEMLPKDTMVMEISSFMLASITKLHPHFAVITNIYSNHLDWHKTRANYVRDKMNITKNQTPNDFLIINFNSPEWRKLSQQSKATVVPFCTNGASEKGAYEKDGKLYFRGHCIMKASDIKIRGQYNVENALASIAVAKLHGCSDNDIIQVLTSFKGASNRNQFVTNYQKRMFVNDSKSTNVESTISAINSYSHPEVLLLGGLNRGYTMKTFDKLLPSLKKHVHAVTTFGQTSKMMGEVAKKAGITSIKEDKTLPEATKDAYKLSNLNDVILLSPANASWDQYPNFEVRGKAYVKAIKNLGKKSNK